MCKETHIPIGIRVRGNNKLGETRIPATPASFTRPSQLTDPCVDHGLYNFPLHGFAAEISWLVL